MKLKQNNIKAIIAMLENATSKDEMRRTMQCVRIEKIKDNDKGEKEIEIAAVDGHILCRKKLKLEDSEETLYEGAGFRFINRDKLGFLKLLAKEKYIPQDISQYFETGEVDFPALSIFNDNFEKKYQNQISFNPELLLAILKATKDVDLKTCGVTLSFDNAVNNNYAPIIVSCGNTDNLLMPLRGMEDHKAKWKLVEEKEAANATA